MVGSPYWIAVPEARDQVQPPINQYRKIGFVQTQVAVKLSVSVRRSTKWKPTSFGIPEQPMSEYQALIWGELPDIHSMNSKSSPLVKYAIRELLVALCLEFVSARSQAVWWLYALTLRRTLSLVTTSPTQ